MDGMGPDGMGHTGRWTCGCHDWEEAGLEGDETPSEGRGEAGLEGDETPSGES